MAFPKKIITMALLGAIGAAAGALVAETLFQDGRVVQPTEPRTICLLFDVSGSMAEVIRGAPTDLQSPRLRTRPSLVPKGGEVTQIMELQRAAGTSFGARISPWTRSVSSSSRRARGSLPT